MKITTYDEKLDYLRRWLTRAAPQIGAAAPPGAKQLLAPERVARIVLYSLNQNPSLLDVSARNPVSFCAAVVACVSLGLEPGGPMRHAYLVPFKDKIQLVIGYPGYVDLATRPGSQVARIEAHPVYAGDVFALDFGSRPRLVHKPLLVPPPGKTLAEARGQRIGAYAVAYFRDGREQQFEWMPEEDIQRIKQASLRRAQGRPTPWADPDSEPEMARTRPIRRLAKYLPMAVQFQIAASLDAQAEAGDQDLSLVDSGAAVLQDLRIDAPPPLPETTTDKPNNEPAEAKPAEEPRVDGHGPDPVSAEPEPAAREEIQRATSNQITTIRGLRSRWQKAGGDNESLDVLWRDVTNSNAPWPQRNSEITSIAELTRSQASTLMERLAASVKGMEEAL